MITLAKARRLTRKHKKGSSLSLDVVAYLDGFIKTSAETGEYSVNILEPQKTATYGNFSVKEIRDVLIIYEAYGYDITMKYINHDGIFMTAVNINSMDCSTDKIKEIKEIKISWVENSSDLN